jgi:hypothetical protein
MPPGFILRFVDNAGADMTVVLPDLIASEDELSDEELDQAAGRRYDAPPRRNEQRQDRSLDRLKFA